MTQVKNFDNIVRVVVPEASDPVVPVVTTPPGGGAAVPAPTPAPPAFTTKPPLIVDPIVVDRGGPTISPTPTNIALNTKLISAVSPTKLIDLFPATTNVAQAVFRADNGRYFMTQANGDPEDTVVSRMDSSGKLMDFMRLQSAGHGLTLGVEVLSGVEWVWVSWSGTLMRFPYKAGTYNKGAVPSTQTLAGVSGFDAFGFDFASDRVLASNGRVFELHKVSELKNNVSTAYGKQVLVQNAPPTLQGFTTINGAFFRWLGANNGESRKPADPTRMEQYAWDTGQRVDAVNYPDLGKAADGKFRDNSKEPESATVYRSANGNANLMVCIVVGKPSNRYWKVYIFADIAGPPV